MRGQFLATDQQEWIHILEFKAVHNALVDLGDSIENVCIRLWCDNMTVVSCLKKGYSPKADIRHWLKAIDQVLVNRGASLIVQWIASKDNVPADTLSRTNVGDAHQLNRDVFQQLAHTMGDLDIDRFATALNTLLPRFNSYFHESGCHGVDAFA